MGANVSVQLRLVNWSLSNRTRLSKYRYTLLYWSDQVAMQWHSGHITGLPHWQFMLIWSDTDRPTASLTLAVSL